MVWADNFAENKKSKLYDYSKLKLDLKSMKYTQVIILKYLQVIILIGLWHQL